MKRHTHSTAFPYRTPYDVLDPMGYYKPPYTYRKPRKVWRCVLLHTQRGDCTHTWCYTPYFFAQLWMSLATALR